MPKYIIELSAEEKRIVTLVKGIRNISSIDKAVSFIVRDYARMKPRYRRILLQEKRR